MPNAPWECFAAAVVNGTVEMQTIMCSALHVDIAKVQKDESIELLRSHMDT